MAKITEDKIVIKQFKSGESSWWVNDAHYSLNESGELIWHAGEVDKPELRVSLENFIKRNKKVFREASPNIFQVEPKQYLEIIPFGDFKGQSVSIVFETNKKLLTWMRDKYPFNSTQEKLKQEITEILKT